MIKLRNILLELAVVVIITIPAFSSLLNNNYFSMHDDQHIARLYLLDQGIKQGNLFPRWVGELGFGYGYPLYNFYPPFIYYTAEAFHLMGMSYIWSIKAMAILGFLIGAVGIYLLSKKITQSKLAALLGETLYTYFFYHSVLIYVRGALAEFFALAVLPFVFLTYDNLSNKTKWTNILLFGISLAILILTHPLIAFPAVFFLGFAAAYYIFRSKNKLHYLKTVFVAMTIGLSLSAFYWLPSMVERKFTLVDKILTGELANYKLHYINFSQFIYSPWGYGGSGQGLADGMTFQLGKVQIGFVIMGVILSVIYLFKKRKQFIDVKFFYFILSMLFFSLFMTTQYSLFIWDSVKFLWYMQFPWRFLTFTAVFISLVGSYFILFFKNLLNSKHKVIINIFTVAAIIAIVIIYQKYFKPQQLISITDKVKTSYQEIAWGVSSTSYEYVPEGVATMQTKLGTTTLAIQKNDLPKSSYQNIIGELNVEILVNKFHEKVFQVEAFRTTMFRLNTYNFPGWTAYIDGKKTSINDRNDLKLITILVSPGKHDLIFRFEDTAVRKIGNIISLISLVLLFIIVFKTSKQQRKHQYNI